MKHFYALGIVVLACGVPTLLAEKPIPPGTYASQNGDYNLVLVADAASGSLAGPLRRGGQLLGRILMVHLSDDLYASEFKTDQGSQKCKIGCVNGVLDLVIGSQDPILLYPQRRTRPVTTARDGPAPDPFAGLFSDDRVTLQLTAGAEGRYQGTIQMGDKKYAITATREGNKAMGEFVVAQDTMGVTLEAVEGGVKLLVGAKTYTLRRPPPVPDRGLGKADPGEEPLPPGKYKLVQKWVPGNYTVQRTADTNEVSGVVVMRSLVTTTTAVAIAQADDDGRIKVTQRLTRMRTSADAVGRHSEFDSANPRASNDPSAVYWAALIGAPFQVVIGPTGRVDEVSGLDEFVTRMKNTNEMAGVVLNNLKQQLRMGMEAVLMVGIGRTLPAKPVGVGDTWGASYPVPVPNMGDVEAKGKATFVSLDGTIATLAFEGAMHPENLPAGAGVEITISSQCQMDVGTGMVLSTKGTASSLYVMGNRTKKTVVTKSAVLRPQ